MSATEIVFEVSEDEVGGVYSSAPVIRCTPIPALCSSSPRPSWCWRAKPTGNGGVT